MARVCALSTVNCYDVNASVGVITFRVRHSRGEMYIDHGRLCVCQSLAAFPHYCMDLDVSWGNGRGCPLVVHYWTDLQSVHGFRCYNNIAPNAKCWRVLVLALCLVSVSDQVLVNGVLMMLMCTHTQYMFDFVITLYKN